MQHFAQIADKAFSSPKIEKNVPHAGQPMSRMPLFAPTAADEWTQERPQQINHLSRKSFWP
jgi:hypothetical protein